AHGQFVNARALDVAADSEQARATVAFRADFGIGFAAHQQNVRHGGDGFGVVDDGGAAVESDYSREWRLDAGNAALAFERLHQRRLFADFVRASAGLRHDVEVDAGTEDVLAEEAPGVGIGDSLLHDLAQVAILAAQVDEAHLRADGEPGDHGAFNYGVRIVQKDEMVLAGAGLTFVSVDEDVLGLVRLLWNERPFKSRGKARAAATAQTGSLHL